MLGVEVNVIDVQVDKLLQPDTGAEEQLNDDPVPDGQCRGPPAEFFKQFSLLSLSKK